MPKMVGDAPRPSGRQLARQFAAVMRDLPPLLTAPLYRRRHLGWGATPQERVADMPGDELFPLAQYRSTRAITIQAQPEAVWPWLVQVGCGQGGLLQPRPARQPRPPQRDHDPSRLPAPRGRSVGADVTVRHAHEPDGSTGAVLRRRPLAAVGKPDSSWAWQLTPDEHGGTRLITRIHAVYEMEETSPDSAVRLCSH
jgi:hypothetical protein